MHWHSDRSFVVEKSIVEVLFQIRVVSPHSLSSGSRDTNTKESVILSVQLLVEVDRRNVAYRARVILFLAIIVARFNIPIYTRLPPVTLA